MSALRNLFEPSITKSEGWIRDMMEEAGWSDPRRAYSTMRAVLHTLRDRLTPHEAADLASNMPMLLRGLYYEGWHPENRPRKYRHREDFLDHVASLYARNRDEELEPSVAAVFRVLERHIPAGELEKVRAQLPKDIRSLWPQATAV